FRTPLTLLLGPLGETLARTEHLLAPEDRLNLAAAHRNALRLQKLVNTLLDFSRIEAGRAEASYEATDLAAFTADLASGFRSTMEQGSLRFIVDCPPLPEPVWVDRELWEKIVLNLLSNAFKFTLAGEVHVKLREEGGNALLQVRDTGVGIPEAERTQVFTRFHRIQGQRGRSYEGTGIGLALVHELVKLHAGHIQADSVEGGGTTFTVSIPFGTAHLAPERLRESPAIAAASLRSEIHLEEALHWLEDSPQFATADGAFTLRPQEGQTYPGNPRNDTEPHGQDLEEFPRILVADDNADMRAYVTRLLQNAQYSVEAVADGAAALATVRQRRPDLVVTDVMMPNLDGFGLLRAIRDDPALQDLPVVLLSARAGEEARIEGLQAGADDYLTKPFSARELVATITTHVRIAQFRARTAVRERELRSEAERERRRAVGILESITDAFYALDLDWRYTYMNRQCEIYYGRSREELLGQVFWDAFPGARGSEFEQQYRKALEEQTAVHFEVLSFFSRRWVEMHVYPSPDGLAVYFRDITERRQAADALQEQANALREADRRKDEFLAMLAHELRNPLSSVNNAVLLLRRLNESEDSREVQAEETAWAYDVISRQTQQLARLVDDLLDVSRISRGKIMLRKQRFDLATVLDHAVQSVRPLLSERNHTLSLDYGHGLHFVNADPTRLEQIVLNLLTNAAKYTPAGGFISLSARREMQEVVIEVRDNGLGIAPSRIPEMFELFAQGERSIARSEGGLGIGLTVVKKLVEMHNGEVTAHSSGDSTGSTFTVRLPTVEPPEAVPQIPNETLPSPPTGNKVRVLVVDDNVDTAQGLSRLLKRTGYEVRTTFDGPNALELAREFAPQVVLLDLGLPGMDGYATATQLRTSESCCREALIIAISGLNDQCPALTTKASKVMPTPIQCRFVLQLQLPKNRLFGFMPKTDAMKMQPTKNEI
ncbi:MAG: response regulator, partial [Verrucomicrobiaceae bacterium]